MALCFDTALWCLCFCDLEESSNGQSGDSEDDTGSEQDDDTDGEETEGLSEEEDMEDRSGKTVGVCASRLESLSVTSATGATADF